MQGPEGRTTPGGGNGGLTPFQRAMLWTAAPLVALNLISVGGAWEESLYWVWAIALLAWLVTAVVGIGFSIAGKRETAAGVWAGFAIGLVALFVSCFANLSLLSTS
jgi:hypothetical protein